MNLFPTYRISIHKAAYLAMIPLLFLSLLPLAADAQSAGNTWTAPDSTAELTNPLEQSKKIVNAGNQIYQQLCTVCHGKGGRGDGVTAAALNPKPADLTGDAVQAQSDGALYWKIWEGRPPMPGFKSQLSERQAWAVVSFLRSLKKEQ